MVDFPQNPLACVPNLSDECHHRGIAAQGESNMTNSIAEEKGNTPAEETARESKPAKKARNSARAAHAAPSKAKPAKKATASKNAPKGKKAAKARESASAREGSKTAQVIALLERKGGATLAEIMEKMGWQRHTVRGFMAGAMKKAGFTVESFKPEGGERTYRISH
jgi:hypothetical protein